MFSPTTFRLVFQGTQKSVDIVRQAIGEHGRIFWDWAFLWRAQTPPSAAGSARAPRRPGFRGLVSGAPAADSCGKESREPCLSRAGTCWPCRGPVLEEQKKVALASCEFRNTSESVVQPSESRPWLFELWGQICKSQSPDPILAQLSQFPRLSLDIGVS